MNIFEQVLSSGKGVSYCATCDADFFTELDVAVIGGGDSALTEAIYLTKFANNVTVILRRDKFRAAKSIQERAFANPKINVIYDTVVDEALVNGGLDGLVLRNVKTNEIITLKVDGCFVCVGYIPETDRLKGKVVLDDFGYIITDEDMRCDVPGIFAAGDIRQKSVRQAITAAADGAIAAVTAEKYIEQ